MDIPAAEQAAWRELAACRHIPVDFFYPPTDAEAEPAKIVCRGCPVTELCLERALAADERFGVWGGLTPAERRSLVARRRNRSAAARPLLDEGQPARA
ncbi:MAG TPA: WhiB family transcriptional regulator [Actinomycetota bacterium]|nr:WhiB family transcriptional regulator [Actinomycetota bacterium]